MCWFSPAVLFDFVLHLLGLEALQIGIDLKLLNVVHDEQGGLAVRVNEKLDFP